MKKHIRIAGLFLLLFGTLLLPAASFNVTNLLDDGSSGSLRWAINQANGLAGPHTIDVLVGGTIVLGSNLPTLSEDLTINGNNITLDGGVLYTAFTITEDLNVTLNNLTLWNCASVNEGSALFIDAEGAIVEVNNCIFLGNESGDKGGAVWNNGTLTINNSEFRENESDIDGGAILMHDNEGFLTINETTFQMNISGDQGGAISFENGGEGVINTCYFYINQAIDDGGAIYFSDGIVSINNSLFYDNTSGDSGGAIQIGQGETRITNTTFSNNDGVNGGAIRVTSDATLILESVTIAENTASNRGGGVRVDTDGSLTIGNTIIANNSAGPGDDVQIDGTLTSNGYNIVSVDDLGDFTPTSTNDMLSTDPMLGPLANNGGPTLTHALLAGSPAMNQGYQGCLSTDQRLYNRNDGNCDIGAFEFGAQPIAIPAMGTWGILVLCLLIMIGSVVMLQSPNNQRKSALYLKPVR